MYECQQGCSNCGPKSSIALTDSRVITREKQPDTCCGCIKGAHIDTTIFLHDIQLLRESKQRTSNSCLAACASGNCLPLLCNMCCGSCCGDRPKLLEVKGGFNSEYLIFKAPDVPGAANDIMTMIIATKNKK